MFKLSIRRQKRQILHIDADAFFASVEQVLNPTLRGKAVLVGGPSATRGIVSACSYEAKGCGVSSGMPMYLATRKCPHAIVVPGNFDAYRRFSKRMYFIFSKYTPIVEMASIDEAYLDITGFEETYKKSSAEIARSILIDAYKTLGLSLSCGLASNKTVAKTASSANKPHKLTVVPYGKERDFLAPMDLSAIPGIGPQTCRMLNRYGYTKVGDVSSMSDSEVIEKFGIRGIHIWKKCLGVDNSPVIAESNLPKSISKEKTFYSTVRDKKECIRMLKILSGEVFEKLRGYEMKAQTIFVRIKYKHSTDYDESPNGRGAGERSSFFENVVFQQNLGTVSSSDNELFPAMKSLFLKNVVEGANIRLVGVGVSNLVQNYNLNFFGDAQKNDRLFMAIDTANKLFGDGVVGFGV